MKLLLFIFCVTFSSAFYGQIRVDPKINGISFVASREPAKAEEIDPLYLLNANFVAVMPFGFVESLEHPKINYNSDRQWFGETSEGVTQSISQFHSAGIKVMLKPQIWIWNGEFTGYLKMLNETDWKILESSYERFILDFATVAEESHVEIFCIGTELEQFIVHRPQFWNQLIQKIKKIYRGKLTYAANWDEYARVPFWDQLDVIGVDAYFPISEEKTPTVSQSKKGWQRWKTELKSLSEAKEKPILFTEFGYRNTDYSGKEPWHSSREMKGVNHDVQGNLLTALFEEVWNEPWMAGGFLWKWHPDNENSGGELDNQFTVQNKPAQMVIQYYYSEKED